nr:NBS-LRR disease resistance protein [Dasypyrum villosum]
MAELGGMLAAAILKVVGEQIGSVIGGQITLKMNFDEDLNKMKMALEGVDALLEDAERRSIKDKSTRLWLKRLKDFMYEVSDMIDEFEADTQAIIQPSARKSSFKKYLATMISCLTIGPEFTMANKMDSMRQGLEEITDQHKKFKLMEGTNASEPKVTDIRETSSTLETHIIGRTMEKEKILASLSESMKKEITILPIYGIGGLGKTTLAKMLYNSSQFREYSQVWVYVSQTFDLKKIGNSIISQLSQKENESGYTGKQMIRNSLQKLTAHKNILIVLDDLWEDNNSHLEELMGLLKVEESGKVVVIVTTRYEGIAKKICTIQPHKLAPLTDDQCWNIIKQKSEFELRDDKEELHHIGQDIASKCRGVALAAQSLGHMLHSLSFDEWESVRKSDFWNLSNSEDTTLTHALASLKLSYSVMPSYLKICFAYCAIFPKGYKIVKDDLIHQWISLGFIKATNNSSTWQLGEKCIRQLLGLSFLEHSKSTPTTGMDYENGRLFTMHDLVHDLARLVMVDEVHVASKEGNTGGGCCHFALLHDCCKPLESSKIRALRFMGCDKSELHDATFSSAKSMRVLDLSKCSMHKFPDSIHVLKQLRYLSAPRIQDGEIPDSITKLSKLIYLNLHGSPKILALPESIGEIEGLMYLDLSGCSRIEELPDSLRRLKELVHLDLSNCSCVRGISAFLGSLKKLQYLNLSYCPNIGEIPEDLSGLSKLQYLNLSFSSYLHYCQEAEFLGAFTKLEYLNLSSDHSVLQKLPEALGRFIQLKYLNLSGCRDMTILPMFSGSLNFLVHLDLSHCYSIYRLQEALVGLTNLRYLNLRDTCLKPQLEDDGTKFHRKRSCLLGSPLENNHYGNYFQSLINHLGNNLIDLEHLDLSYNRSLERIPESICRMRKLHTLDLSECILLAKIPESIHTLVSLKFLYLKGCDLLCTIPQLGGSTISLPYFVVRAGDDESSSNLVLLQSTNPIELQISELENVKSPGEAHRIKLVEKHRLKDLKLEWTRGVERIVYDKILLKNLVPPSTLKKLEICGYNGVSFPAWLVGQLPNLVSLVLRDMANVEEWNMSYSNDEEHVIQTLEIYGCPMLRMKRPLPKAKSWVISHSDNVLSSMDECTVSHTSASSTSPITTVLSVKYCKGPHRWRLLQHFTGLSSLSIHNCGDLTGSPQITHHLSSLEALCLEDEHMEELPKWLGELASLHSLEIRWSNGVTKLNETMRQLTMLQSLNLSYCNNLSLPHWLGELTSLKELVVCSNDVLRSLPESIHQLTDLQKIKISNCPKLEHVVNESLEGMMKRTHNQETVCVLPTSLKELTIHLCHGIKSLPEGIHQLTNLKNLEIDDCYYLYQWCKLEDSKKLAHIQNKCFVW